LRGAVRAFDPRSRFAAYPFLRLSALECLVSLADDSSYCALC